MNIPYTPPDPDFGKSLEHINAEKFFNHVLTEYNFLKSKQGSEKVLKSKIILSNGETITPQRIRFEIPNAIIATEYRDNKDINIIILHYTNCQFVFSIEDKDDAKQTDVEIGFGKPNS